MNGKRSLFAIAIAVAVWSPGAAWTASPVEPIPGKIHPRLAHSVNKNMEGTHTAWVFFADKGSQPLSKALSHLTEDAIRRRAKVGYGVSDGDLPLWVPYVDAVESIAPIRARSKWLNGVSVTVSGAEVRALAELPFVTRIQQVARAARRPSPEPIGQGSSDSRSLKSVGDIAYGIAEAQLIQINVPPLHDAGLSGEGVKVLMLDSGFHTTGPAYTGLDIADRRDFVHDDDVTSDESGQDPSGAENHGSQTLSTIGSTDEGSMVGPAFGATYYLAKTEDVATEYIGEEDFWVEGIEWGESLGVVLASSSLGYNQFDEFTDSYTFEDMNGETAIVTLAAREAVRRGIVVVNSMGNEGNVDWNKMIAPADADSVISVAAVTVNGVRASFSSIGPTADGRIKPDVAALGQGTALSADPRNMSDPYGFRNGTSFSCPLVAGVCALLLEAHPNMTPHDIIPRLKSTASQSSDPDTLLGWGIVDAFQAALPPHFLHDAIGLDDWSADAYHGTAKITAIEGFGPPQLIYGDASGFTDTLELALPGKSGGEYAFAIPAAEDEPVRYFFRIAYRDSLEFFRPPGGAGSAIEIGDATAPTIAHDPEGNITTHDLPLIVSATIADGAGIDSAYVPYSVAGGPNGSFALDRGDGSAFTGVFPDSLLTENAVIEYTVVAVDSNGNRATDPSSGTHTFQVVSPDYALHHNVDGEGPTNPFLRGAGGKHYEIFFDLPRAETVTIEIFDVAGRLVTELTDDRSSGSGQSISWDLSNDSGVDVTAGVYLLRFQAGSFEASRKFVIIDE